MCRKPAAVFNIQNLILSQKNSEIQAHHAYTGSISCIYECKKNPQKEMQRTEKWRILATKNLENQELKMLQPDSDDTVSRTDSKR